MKTKTPIRRHLSAHLQIVDDDLLPPSEGDWEMFRARRERERGLPPTPPTVRAPPLEREKLAERQFGVVVESALVEVPARETLRDYLKRWGWWAMVLMASAFVLAVIGQIARCTR